MRRRLNRLGGLNRYSCGSRKVGMSWSEIWHTLISVTVEDADRDGVNLTFQSSASLDASDFTVTVNGENRTVNSATWAGAVMTLVLSSNVATGDVVVVTFVKTGDAANATNNVVMWYGIEIDESNSSPDLTRIASSAEDMALHASLPVQSEMKGCLLADDGSVNYYLNSTDWSKKASGVASLLDGTDGQVMIEIPAFYYKVDMNTPSVGVHRIKISTAAITGFTLVPKRYISAYEATLNRTTSVLASVKNTTVTYRGGANTSAYDGNANSLLGCPATAISRENFRTYARSRGAGWNMVSYDDHKWLYWFYVIEYATLNSQKAFDASLTAEGYKKGGLGTGVTNASASEWSAFNSSNPFIPCGKSDSLGNASGTVDCVKPDFGGNGIDRSFSVPRYRGIENPFGHMMTMVDGCILQNQSDADGGNNIVFATDDASLWNDTDFSSYRFVGVANRGKAISKIAILGQHADFIASLAEGSDAGIYYCDYHYTAVPANTSTVLRALMVGGRCADNTLAGMVYVNFDRAASYTSNSYGSRLRYSE